MIQDQVLDDLDQEDLLPQRPSWSDVPMDISLSILHSSPGSSIVATPSHVPLLHSPEHVPSHNAFSPYSPPSQSHLEYPTGNADLDLEIQFAEPSYLAWSKVPIPPILHDVNEDLFVTSSSPSLSPAATAPPSPPPAIWFASPQMSMAEDSNLCESFRRLTRLG